MLNVEDLYRLLRTGHVQAQGIVDTVPDPMLVLDASLCVQAASRAFFETFGVDRYETIGQPLHALGNGQWNIPELRRLLEEVIPKARPVIDYEVEHDFPELGPRTMRLTARTLYHPDIASHSMLLAIVDVTDQHRRDTAKDMLFGELRHRMKNLLGVALSIARQTPTEGRTAEEYRDAFVGRFSAMAEAQDIAFSEQEVIGLDELLRRVLAPYSTTANTVSIEVGATPELGPKTIMSLGLVLHELATNAAKHGALSVPGGQVRVSTSQEDHDRLRITWVEIGGPRVIAPSVTGYGTKLIQSTVEYSLHGAVEQTYLPAGFQAEIVVPVGTAAVED